MTMRAKMNKRVLLQFNYLSIIQGLYSEERNPEKISTIKDCNRFPFGWLKFETPLDPS